RLRQSRDGVQQSGQRADVQVLVDQVLDRGVDRAGGAVDAVRGVADDRRADQQGGLADAVLAGAAGGVRVEDLAVLDDDLGSERAELELELVDGQVGQVLDTTGPGQREQVDGGGAEGGVVSAELDRAALGEQ